MRHAKLAEDSGSVTGLSDTRWHWQTRSSKDRKQLDYVLMNRASFKHWQRCRSNGIDMTGDHKAVRARIVRPLHKTPQIKNAQRTRKHRSKDVARTTETTRVGTIDVYHAHKEDALNTINSNATTGQATLEELNGKLEDAMTSSASTTQNEQPHDNTTTTNEHAQSVRQLKQKRNSTPNEDRQTT